MKVNKKKKTARSGEYGSACLLAPQAVTLLALIGIHAAPYLSSFDDDPSVNSHQIFQTSSFKFHFIACVLPRISPPVGFSNCRIHFHFCFNALHD